MKLYGKSASGDIMFWQIESKIDLVCYEIKHGQVGGKVQSKIVPVELKKKGCRDIFEQCGWEVGQRIDKKKKQGYTKEMPTKDKKDKTNFREMILRKLRGK